MENIIVGLIVLAAAVFALYRLFFKRNCGCGSGCDCSSSVREKTGCPSHKAADGKKDCGCGH